MFMSITTIVLVALLMAILIMNCNTKNEYG